jgi:hypothetical protein
MQINIKPLSRSGSVSNASRWSCLLADEAPQSSARCGSFTSGSASLSVSTNQRSGNPVQADARDLEVHLAGLDLYRARIDFFIETVWPQHASEVEAK